MLICSIGQISGVNIRNFLGRLWAITYGDALTALIHHLSKTLMDTHGDSLTKIFEWKFFDAEALKSKPTRSQTETLKLKVPTLGYSNALAYQQYVRP